MEDEERKSYTSQDEIEFIKKMLKQRKLNVEKVKFIENYSYIISLREIWSSSPLEKDISVGETIVDKSEVVSFLDSTLRNLLKGD